MKLEFSAILQTQYKNNELIIKDNDSSVLYCTDSLPP